MSSSSLVCVPCDKTFRTDKSLKSHQAHCKSRAEDAESSPDTQETSYILDPVTGDLIVIEPEGGDDHADSDQPIEQLEDVSFTEDYVDQPMEDLEDVTVDKENIEVSDENSLDAGEQDDISIEVDDIDDPPYEAPPIANFESKPKTGAHECSVCHKTFNTYAARVSHLRSKHGLTAKLAPAKDYTKECPICKKMIQFGKIERHMVTHTGEKPFKCDVCNKRFTDKAYVKKHQETQHGKTKTETPPPSDPCEYCGKMVRKTYMKQHLGSVCKEAPAHLKLPVQEINDDSELENGEASGEEETEKFVNEYALSDDIAFDETDNGVTLENNVKTEFENDAQNTENAVLSLVDENGNPQCNICQKTFATRLRLRAHRMIHEDGKDGNYGNCPICSLKFSSKNNRSDHLRFKHGLTSSLMPAKPVSKKCPICLKEIKFGKIRRHILTHNKAKPHKCKICGRRFADKNYVTRHIEVIHHIVPEQFDSPVASENCEYCHLSIPEKHMDQHIREACEKAPEECQVPVKRAPLSSEGVCPVCGMVFNSKYIRYSHLRDKHGLKADLTPTTPYPKAKQCPVCKKMINNGLLDRHMIKHTGDRPYSCDECGKCFVDKHYIQKHKRVIHQNIKGPRIKHERVTCEFCGKTVDRPSLKRHHSTACQKAPPELRSTEQFICKVCGMQLNTKHNLIYHMDRHTDEKHKCSVCGHECNTKYGLVSHLKNHHQLNHRLQPVPAQICVCNICGKQFNNQHKLARHMNGHTKQFKFPCEQCGAVYSEAGSLKKHVRTVHHGLYRFECELCGRKVDTLTAFHKHNCSYIARGVRVNPDGSIRRAKKRPRRIDGYQGYAPGDGDEEAWEECQEEISGMGGEVDGVTTIMVEVKSEELDHDIAMALEQVEQAGGALEAQEVGGNLEVVSEEVGEQQVECETEVEGEVVTYEGVTNMSTNELEISESGDE